MTPESNPHENTELSTEVNPQAAAEIKIVGYCRACGKGLDAPNARHMNGTIYCEEHVPLANAGGDPSSPWTAAGYRAGASPPPLPTAGAAPSGSPVLAFLLGLIPGVGAIYNGQYAKGFIHVVIFGLLVSIVSSGAAAGMEPLFGLMIAGFTFYMPFEAYHTAKKRQSGQTVDEWSGMVALRHGSSRVPAGPLVLIVVGVIFLLNNLGLWDIRRAMRYWPAVLIVLGTYMLWSRMTEEKTEAKRERE